MPENEEKQNARSGGADRRPPPGRAAKLNRLLVMCLTAMAVGYFMSGWTKRLFADSEPSDRRFETMATYGRIFVPRASGTAESPSVAAEAAETAVKEVNDLMSPFGEASDIRRLNETPAGEWVEVSPHTWNVVMEALRWNRLSGGAFDPTIGPLKKLFTFEQQEAVEWPDEKSLADARARVGADKLLFDREGMRLSWKTDGMRLDLGAIAKGYGSDRAAETLLASGAANALVDIGGELRLLGGRPGADTSSSAATSPWRAGIRNPRGNDVLERLDLENAAVATSGDYENFFLYKGERYEHIIDPRSGLPLKESVASVTVIHPDSCLAADALATTLTVLGVEEGRAFLEEQALGLFTNGVRVIMLSPEKDGRLRRVEYNIDKDGMLTTDETVVDAGSGEQEQVS
jgi:thiamine biosynthesis lipoprotein